MDFQNLASKISELVGTENITNATHCVTRLRLQVADPAKVDIKGLEELPEVKKVITNGKNVQIVIGNEVEDVYKEFTKLINITEDAGETKVSGNAFKSALTVVSECLTPIIPALSAGGLINAFMTLFKSLGWVDTSTMTYTLFTIMGSAPLYFLPFFLAYSVSKRLKANTMLSMCLAAFMLYPDFVSLMGGSDAVTFFGLPVKLVTYTQSLIPIVLAVFVQKYVEDFLKKVIPNNVLVIFIPCLTYLIMCTLVMLVIGPIAGYLQDGITAIIKPLSEKYNWAVCMLLGGTYLVLVGAGIHHGLLPLAVAGFVTNGYDSFMGPSMFCTVFALGGACLGLAIRSKTEELKQTALSTSFSTFLGITEPAIYGVAFRNKRTLLAAVVGGAVGGCIAGIFGVATYGLAPAGITSFALLGQTMGKGLIAIGIAFALGFGISFALGEDQKA